MKSPAKLSLVSILIYAVSLCGISTQAVNEKAEWSILTEFQLTERHAGAGFYANEQDKALRNKTPYNEDWDVKAIGVRKENMTFGYSSFTNSYYLPSQMLSFEYSLISSKPRFSVDFGVGLVKGYSSDVTSRDNILIGEGEYMVIPTFAISFLPELLDFGKVKIVPKLRTYGFVTLMGNLEVSYKS